MCAGEPSLLRTATRRPTPSGRARWSLAAGRAAAWSNESSWQAAEPDTQGSRVSTAALWAGKSKAWTAWSHRVALEPLRGAGQNADPTVFDYICRHLKRTDFCLWSAPPAPLAGVVGALLGDDFPRTVYEHNCSGFLQDCSRSVKLIPVAPVVSENILLCGMREVNASLSKECDRNHWVAQQNWWRWR